MRKAFLVLVVLLVAGFAFGQVKVSGDTGGTVYTDMLGVGVLDTDQNLTIAYGPVSLALNAGYTRNLDIANDTVTFGYTATVAQKVDPFTFTVTAASNALTYPLATKVLTGDWLGDMTGRVDFASGDVSAIAYALFTAKKGYPNFMGTDISGTYAPKIGAVGLSFTLGGSFLDPKAASDDVGHVNTVATVKGLSFYGKVKVSY